MKEEKRRVEEKSRLFEPKAYPVDLSHCFELKKFFYMLLHGKHSDFLAFVVVCNSCEKTSV